MIYVAKPEALFGSINNWIFGALIKIKDENLPTASPGADLLVIGLPTWFLCKSVFRARDR